MVVNHFHLRVPKRGSVLTLGAFTCTRETTLARAAYLVVDWKAQFCLDVNADPPTLPSPAQAWYRISVVSEM